MSEASNNPQGSVPPTEAKSGEVPRFGCLEGLRMWMAWWVVSLHALHLAGMTAFESRPVHLAYRAFNHGHSAVDVFIILSGFVITHLLRVKKESYGAYIVRRFFRLFPLLAVAVLAVLCMPRFYREAFVETPWAYRPEMRIERLESTEEHFAEHLALKLSMLHGVVPEEVLPYSTSSILSPAWSISLEWQFYLVAPLILLMVTRSLWAGVTFAVGALILSSFVNHLDAYHWQYPAFLPLELPLFLLGIGTRLFFETSFSQKVCARSLALLVTSLTVLFLALTLSGVMKFPLGVFIFLVFLPILLSETGRLVGAPRLVDSARKALFENKQIELLGRWSYSTYLIHTPVFVAATGIWKRTFGLDSRGEHLLCLLIAFPVVAGLSWLTYRWVETPGVHLGRILAKRIAAGSRKAGVVEPKPAS